MLVDEQLTESRFIRIVLTRARFRLGLITLIGILLALCTGVYGVMAGPENMVEPWMWGDGKLAWVINLEYEWAHKCCNQIKLNMPFFHWVNTANAADKNSIWEYQVDQSQIELFYQQIQEKAGSSDTFERFPCEPWKGEWLG